MEEEKKRVGMRILTAIYLLHTPLYYANQPFGNLDTEGNRQFSPWRDERFFGS